MKIKFYLKQTKILLNNGQYSDGCTSFFKAYIHRWLKRSRLLCAAHDFGGLGLIKGVRPGWHNNWVTWLAHLAEPNPIYWLWGTIIALVTLPWVIWRRNFNIKIFDMVGFYVIFLLFTVAIPLLIIYRPD